MILLNTFLFSGYYIWTTCHSITPVQASSKSLKYFFFLPRTFCEWNCLNNNQKETERQLKIVSKFCNYLWHRNASNLPSWNSYIKFFLSFSWSACFRSFLRSMSFIFLYLFLETLHLWFDLLTLLKCPAWNVMLINKCSNFDAWSASDGKLQLPQCCTLLFRIRVCCAGRKNEINVARWQYQNKTVQQAARRARSG